MSATSGSRSLSRWARLLVFYYVGQERNRLQDGEEHVSVWVATKNIPEGTVGSTLESGGYIEKAEVERDLIAPGALLQPNDVSNKLVANTIYKGEQVSALRFRSEAEKGIRAQLTGTLRAVQVPGSKDQFLSGTLESGDRVDVVATIKYKFVNFGSVRPAQRGADGDRTVLRDILVLRPATQTNGDTEVDDGAKDDGSPAGSPTRSPRSSTSSRGLTAPTGRSSSARRSTLRTAPRASRRPEPF